MIEELIWMIRFNAGELFIGAVCGFVFAMALGYYLGGKQK